MARSSPFAFRLLLPATLLVSSYALPLGCSAGSSNEIGNGGNNSGAGQGGALSSGIGGIGVGQGGNNTGGSDACAAETYDGELVPLDLHVVLDRSASMNDGGKWNAVISALQAFIAEPTSAGVGIGLQYFPVPPSSPVPTTCNGDPNDPACGLYGPCLPGFNLCGGSFAPNDSCDPVDYQTPEIPIALLPGVAQAVNDSLAANSPSGDSTPSQPSMEGAATYATTWAAMNPSHVTVIVLATDGEPTGCSTNSVNGTAAAAASAFAANPSVLTFVVGVGSELTSLNQIAQAGGTQQAFLVDTSANVTQQFIDALNEIRQTGACQVQIPVPTSGTPDFGKVNVNLVDPNDPTNKQELFNVGSEAGCDPVEGGWYYDDPNDPKTILLCDASCEQVNLTGWDVEVLLGCETIVK